jgi:hypothetical protein
VRVGIEPPAKQLDTVVAIGDPHGFDRCAAPAQLWDGAAVTVPRTPAFVLMASALKEEPASQSAGACGELARAGHARRRLAPARRSLLPAATASSMSRSVASTRARRRSTSRSTVGPRQRHGARRRHHRLKG